MQTIRSPTSEARFFLLKGDIFGWIKSSVAVAVLNFTRMRDS